ncbi:hypothetical protein TNCV_1237701 [Trichonephila clavipes]|nr:hypothetical protein TNCV_1237701 [Trichonephila clavipes]
MAGFYVQTAWRIKDTTSMMLFTDSRFHPRRRCKATTMSMTVFQCISVGANVSAAESRHAVIMVGVLDTTSMMLFADSRFRPRRRCKATTMSMTVVQCISVGANVSAAESRHAVIMVGVLVVLGTADVVTLSMSSSKQA